MPLIVNCPGTVPKGIVTDNLVDFSDFLPTLADITGAPLPNVKLDGRSSGRSALVKKEIQENGSSNTTIRNLHPQPSLTAKELMGSKSFGLKIKTLNCIEMGHFTLTKTGMKNGRSPWEKIQNLTVYAFYSKKPWIPCPGKLPN